MKYHLSNLPLLRVFHSFGVSSPSGRFGVVLLFLVACLVSCGEKEFYADEQYRKECYIVSDDNNVFGQEYTYGENSTGYISIYVSGSAPVDEDVTITLRQADEYLKEYNQRVNGTAYANYVEALPADSYSLPNGWDAVVTPEDTYVKFPIVVDVNRLDPTKKYFLPLEIARVSNYQYSATKNYVLFQIFMKNAYATTRGSTYYQMYGNTVDLKENKGKWEEVRPGESPTAFNATKKMTPLSENSVCILPGTLQSTDQSMTDTRGIRLIVTDEVWQCPILGDDGLPTGKTFPVNIVEIEPLNEGSGCVQVHTATNGIDQDDEENQLRSYYDPATKTFMLYYCYRMPTERSGSAPLWHKVKEQMTLLDY